MKKIIILILVSAMVISCNVIEAIDGGSKIDKGFFGNRPHSSPYAHIVASQIFHDFGTLADGSASFVTITLDNQGEADATTISTTTPAFPFLYRGGSYPGSGGTCGLTLGASLSCTIVFEYQASGDNANETENISLSYFDGSGTQNLTIDLQGSSFTTATLFISSHSNPHTFANLQQGFSHTETFTLTNSGSGPANNIVASVTDISGTQSIRFNGGMVFPAGGDCGTDLAAGTSCQFMVEFRPQSAGYFSETIDIMYDDGSGSGFSMTLSLDGQGDL